VIEMAGERAKSDSPIYSAWFGKPVVLVVVVRQCRVPLTCSIVGESVGDVRVRVEAGWEINVRKELIIGVEERGAALDSRIS
jgi:hypothetical protein